MTEIDPWAMAETVTVNPGSVGLPGSIYTPSPQVRPLDRRLPRVAAGLGVSAFPELVLPLMPSAGIATRALTAPVMHRDLAIITRADETPAPLTARFVERLDEIARRFPVVFDQQDLHDRKYLERNLPFFRMAIAPAPAWRRGKAPIFRSAAGR